MFPPEDGPHSSNFSPIHFRGNVSLQALGATGVSDAMAEAAQHAARGACTAWGVRFVIGDDVVLVKDQPATVEFAPTEAQWFIFMHASDLYPPETNMHGFISPMRGEGRLGEQAASYVFLYEDSSQVSVPIRRRHQLGAFQRNWGENCFEAVPQRKQMPLRASHEQTFKYWGGSQTRNRENDFGAWVNWLWAWENPHPDRAVRAVRFEPAAGAVIVSAISAGKASSLPLRWCPRSKALLTLPAGEKFLPELDERGLLSQIQLDMGQVISATPQLLYSNASWAQTYNNQLPVVAEHKALVEYTAHPDACFHLSGGQVIPVAQVESRQVNGWLEPVSPARQRVTIRVLDQRSRRSVPVKLHVHGEAGEYLAPLDRHRIINTAWFEDYSVDFAHKNTHACTYIPGETRIDLPLGKVYLEASKGFEIKPVRRVVEITPATEEIVIELEKVLDWREKGWVTADTHVHFLSPVSALLEGSAEGVNIVNLLASQWGELMTNVGDFDGKTTWGSREAGGDGEYLVRVGSENRQHVLGHISLLGYSGGIIAPMTTGGPDESAIGDPVEILMAEWARQCKKQGGVVVLPHFPNPRAEHSGIVSGDIDAVEMTSWGNLYGGINPYSLSDWYRYLNCGYLVAAVGGTDKMTADTPVGAVRTYARIPENESFTYDRWMKAIRRAETFVTYGPLLEFTVDGHGMGSAIQMSASGGTLAVHWRVASATIPMTRVELVVNGEIRASAGAQPWDEQGYFSFKAEKSCWLALLVRGHYPDQPEIIAAHSSPVMVQVQDTPLLAAADALTILEQIEGTMAYLDTVGTRASDLAYKRMRLVLESAHRSLHNRMHQAGQYHLHTPVTDHPEHHK
jgi:hypothetical protein